MGDCTPFPAQPARPAQAALVNAALDELLRVVEDNTLSLHELSHSLDSYGPPPSPMPNRPSATATAGTPPASASSSR